MYRAVIKPFFDFVFAGMMLIILSPILLLTILIIVASGEKNPFFYQLRPGKNEKNFLIIKLKTMKNTQNEDGSLLPDKERITALGKFIRATSLDEIPQLINVIKGEMSFVGPRPLLPEYLPLYTEFQRQRHLVKPGITGYAQVNGRNAISWEKKFELDVEYVNKISFLLDIRILMLTITKVFSTKEVNASDSATMERFKGSQEL
ncbi:sugar transferase [Altibacter lentus]|uniref:sugar transferase n=1 Tax=Altibacter lentus TaxID=1223410 RepID=UPI00054EBE4C|nr:sugar transferase [Altibacter lentus]